MTLKVGRSIRRILLKRQRVTRSGVELQKTLRVGDRVGLSAWCTLKVTVRYLVRRLVGSLNHRMSAVGTEHSLS